MPSDIYWPRFDTFDILCSIIFPQGHLERTEGSSSRRGLGGSVCVLGAGLIKAWLDVARARETGAKWGRGSEIGAVMEVKGGV